MNINTNTIVHILGTITVVACATTGEVAMSIITIGLVYAYNQL